MKKLFLIFFICIFFLCGCGKKVPVVEELPPEEENIATEKVDIVDPNSNTRPFAVVVNNSAVAVKVQTGLQSAYMVYEIPVEGGLTRLLAFYKDIDDLTIGTIRSARHNFLDYAWEQDAIFVHYGWSHYAKDDIIKTKINNVNGLSDSAFWRENPENLASEHTAYTSLAKIREFSKGKNYSLTTEKGFVLPYDVKDISLEEKSDVKKATNISIPSNASSNTTYIYDEEEKVYKRFVNGKENIDYNTKKQITTKNIIVQKMNTKMASDNHYWDLETVGSGEGFYITNGFSVPITWKKTSRTEKTCYNYLDGSEVTLSDGNTFIQLQSTNQKLTIGE